MAQCFLESGNFFFNIFFNHVEHQSELLVTVLEGMSIYS